MAITGSGQVSLSDIYDEYTGSHSDQEIQLSDYHDEGNAPASGEIQLATDFYGTSSAQATPYAGYQLIYGGYTTNITDGTSANPFVAGTMQGSNSWGSGRGAIAYGIRMVQTSGSGIENYKLGAVAYGVGANYGSQYASQYQNVGYAMRICTGDSVSVGDAIYNVTGTKNFAQGTNGSNRYSYYFHYLTGTIPVLDINTWYTISFKLTSGTPAYGNWANAYAWAENPGRVKTLSGNRQIRLEYRIFGGSEEASGNFSYVHSGGFSPGNPGSATAAWMGMNHLFYYPYAMT